MKILKKISMVSLAIIMAINVSANALTKAEKSILKDNNFTVSSNYDLDKYKEYPDYNRYTEAYKKYLELSDEEKESIEVVPRKYNVSFDDFINNEEKTENVKAVNAKSKDRSNVGEGLEVPPSYDLRDFISINVENQGGYGLCWNFTSLKSLETYLALKEYGNYNFSELHLDYLTSNEFGGNRDLHDGGSFESFEEYLSKNQGPVLEEEVPYNTNYTIDDYEYLLNLDEKAFVSNTIDYPCIYKYFDENNNVVYTSTFLGEYVQLEEGNYDVDSLIPENTIETYRNYVKNHIMNYGSLYSVVATPDNGTDYYNTETNAEYFARNELNDGRDLHAVSIIGWDDNYSKDNFLSDNKPSIDGAYIALNSWGDSWGDNGVFYISYEDFIVEQCISGITEATADITERKTIPIQFPDDNLYNAIKEELADYICYFEDENNEIYLNKLAYQTLSYLNLNNKGITNISGLEMFPNLSTLYLDDNNIENLQLIAFCSNLRELSLNNNNISEVNFNTEYSLIEALYLNNNNIQNVDNLANLGNLRILELGNNNISEINSINNNIFYLKLDGNNLTDLSFLSDITCIYNETDLSNNKNLDLSTLNLGLISSLRLEDCNLSELKFAEVDEEAVNPDTSNPITHSLYVNKNNITDFSTLPDLEYYCIDASENYNIDVSTFENLDITYLLVSDCGLDNEKVNDLMDVTTLSYLDVSKNPIDDLSFILKQELMSLDISETNIKDLSIFGEEHENLSNLYMLNASNNENLEGLDKLNMASITLKNCGLTDLSIFENSNKIQHLNLNNNNITDLSPLNNLSVNTIMLDNNEINDISIISDIRDDIYSISLKNNNISSIEPLKSLNRERSLFLELSGNKINDYGLVDNGIYMTIDGQNIEEDIDIEVGIDNEFDFPEIIDYSYDQRYKEKISFELNNCTMDLASRKIIVRSNNIGEGQASITIRGGKFDGTVYTYNYNVKEELEVIGLDTEYTGRTTYVEGEDFSIEDLKVFLVYENGMVVETEDYNIENSVDLKPENDLVRISYGDYEVFIDILVISKDDSRVVKFNEPIIYDYFITSGWDFESGLIYKNDERLEIVCLYDYLDAEGCDISIFEEVADLTGLSNFRNVNKLELLNYNSSDLTEIANMENLKELLLFNTENVVTDITALMNKNSLEKIDLANTKIKTVNETLDTLNLSEIKISNVFDVTDLEFDDTKVYLPDCYKELLEKCTNPEVYVTYNTNYNMGEVKQDENQKYYVEFDLEEYEEEFDQREIYITLIDSQNGIYLFNEIDYNLKGNDPEEPTPGDELEIELGYPIKNDEYVTEVKSKTSLEDFEKKLLGENNIGVKIETKDNEDLTDEEFVSTGMKVKLLDENNNPLLDSEENPIVYTVVVKGDINGDGSADLIDSKLIKAHRNEVQGCSLTGEKFEAADINNTGTINYIDSNLLKLHIMEVENYNLNNQ